MKEHVRNNYLGLSILIIDWLMIVTTAAISIKINSLPPTLPFVVCLKFCAYITAIWVIGSFQFSIGEVLLHESIHHKLFKTKKFNRWFSIFYAYPFFIDWHLYLTEHLNHHRYLGEESDHVVKDYQSYGLNKKNANIFWLWFIRPLTGYAGCYFLYVHFKAISQSYISLLRMLGFWATVLIIFCYFHALSLLFLYWFIPLVWSFASYLYWSEITDHYHTVLGTRTNLSPLANFLHHNNGYHALHHSNPDIPWYKLPAVQNAMVLSAANRDVVFGFVDTYRKIRQTHL